MADESNDGLIDRNEFEAFLADATMRTWLSAQDLDAANPRLLFDLLDVDGNEHLSLEEICSGMAKLKGPAKSTDLLTLTHMTSRLLRIVQKIHSRTKELKQLSQRQDPCS